MSTPITEASRQMIADIEADAAMWSAEAGNAGDNSFYRAACEAKRDTLRRLLGALPRWLSQVEQEAAGSDRYEHGGRR